MAEPIQGILQWKRLWSRFSDDLVDSAATGGATLEGASAARQTDFEYAQIDHFGCLALLGPPGSGKTTELRRASNAAKEAGHATSLVTFRNISSAHDLHNALADQRATWLSTEGVWSVFLDGLDEIPARIEEARSWIVSWLKDCIRDSKLGERTLRVRITCRSADWPNRFDQDLASVFGVGQVGVYQLAPLSEEDVQTALSSFKADAWEEFRNTLTKEGLWPLAKLPVTLSMLARTFRDGAGKIPTTLVDLYQTALLAMVEDRRQPTVALTPSDPLTAPEKLQLLGRLAAVSVLTNKLVVWTGLYADEVPNDAVPITEVAGGTETLYSQSINADERAFRRVLGTAVFRAAGPQRFTWEHQTFAEYLAARYLDSTNLNSERLLAMLSVEENGKRRIAPQLGEVAAWLSGMRADFRTLLITGEPVLLLRSDVATADEKFKAELTQELLRRFEAGDLHHFWNDSRVDYARLSFPGLADILRPYILDDRKATDSRQAAINIAAACATQELADDLIAVALTDNSDPNIRALAISACRQLGARSLPRVKDILDQPPAADPDDEIRGAVLTALWPSRLTEAELFGALIPPRNPRLLGYYRYFAYRLTIAELTPEGAMAALKWVRTLPDDHVLLSDWNRLIAEVLVAAWKQASDPGVLEGFADVVANVIQDTAAIIRSAELRDFRQVYTTSPPELHRNLVFAVAAKLPSMKSMDLLMAPWELATYDDLGWLLADFVTESAGLPADASLELILRQILPKGMEGLERVWEYAQKSARLKTALEGAYFIEFGTSYAKWLREDYERRTRIREEPPPAPPRTKLVADLLEKCETDVQFWWQVAVALFMGDEPNSDLGELDSALTESPGWRESTPEQRGRIKAFARQYLMLASPPENIDWIGNNTIWFPIMAGYRALRLLYDEDRSDFEKLPQRVWDVWGPTTLWSPSNGDKTDRETQHQIAKIARAKAPRVFMDALNKLLTHPDANFETSEIVGAFLDDDIASAIWRALQQGHLNQHAATRLFGLLISHRFQPIQQAAVHYLTTPREKSDAIPNLESPEVSVPALTFLAFPEQFWPDLLARRSTDRLHANSIWLWIGGHTFGGAVGGAGFIDTLAPAQLAELYAWLAADFTKGEPTPSGFVGPEHQLEQFRGAILNRLVKAGNDESVAAIKWLVEARPEERYLKLHLRAAEDSRREVSWSWLTAQEVLSRLGVKVPLTKEFAESLAAKLEVEAEASAAAPDGAAQAAHLVENITIPLNALTGASGKKLTFLLVGSEWQSAHGGISSFNRDLCKALAKDHTVYCLLPSVDNSDRADASRGSVILVEAPAQVGFKGLELLGSIASAPVPNLVPDAIVGHDHITGREALRLRDQFYPGSKFVHFIHTIPPESELYKNHPKPQAASLVGHDKRARQIALCKEADLVFAVGPRIYSNVCSANPAIVDRVAEFVPGLNAHYLDMNTGVAARSNMSILWLGRGEDPHLKGLDIALEIITLLQNERPDSVTRPKLVVRGLDLEQDSEVIKKCQGRTIKQSCLELRPYSSDADVIEADIKGATCLIMPSQSEPFGLVALEAIALGTPVLISSESGVGNLLMRLSKLSSGAITLHDGLILNVEDDPIATAKDWAQQVLTRLTSYTGAVATAEKFRVDLARHVNWSVAIAGLVKRLNALLRS